MRAVGPMIDLGEGAEMGTRDAYAFRNVLSAKGAVSFLSLGQAPQENKVPKN
jgi:hypothetical protein